MEFQAVEKETPAETLSTQRILSAFERKGLSKTLSLIEGDRFDDAGKVVDIMKAVGLI